MVRIELINKIGYFILHKKKKKILINQRISKGLAALGQKLTRNQLLAGIFL
jgi:hypothetical protein